MAQYSRRSLIQWAGGAALAAQLPDLPLPAAGKIKPRPSSSIPSSAISAGFETLDRRAEAKRTAIELLSDHPVKFRANRFGLSV